MAAFENPALFCDNGVDQPRLFLSGPLDPTRQLMHLAVHVEDGQSKLFTECPRKG